MSIYKRDTLLITQVDEALTGVEACLDGDTEIKGLEWHILELIEFAEETVLRAHLANAPLDQCFESEIDPPEDSFTA